MPDRTIYRHAVVVSLVVTLGAILAIGPYTGPEQPATDTADFSSTTKTPSPSGVQTGHPLWSRTFDAVHAFNGITTSSGDDILVVGDAGLVYRIAANGTVHWNRSVAEGTLATVVRGDEGGYLLGGARPPEVVMVDSTGEPQWGNSYHNIDTFDSVEVVVPAADGGYLVAGDGGTSGDTTDDAWVRKVDSRGEPVWNKTLGGGSWDSIEAGTETRDGAFLLAGTTISNGTRRGWAIKIDASGSVVWERKYHDRYAAWLRAIHRTEDGYLLAGSAFNSTATGYDAWLLKIDERGKKRWERFHGVGIHEGGCSETTSERVESIVPLDDGYLLAGWKEDYRHCQRRVGWVVKTTERGQFQWSELFDGNGSRSFLDGARAGTDVFLVGEADGGGWAVKLRLDPSSERNRTTVGRRSPPPLMPR